MWVFKKLHDALLKSTTGRRRVQAARDPDGVDVAGLKFSPVTQGTVIENQHFDESPTLYAPSPYRAATK